MTANGPSRETSSNPLDNELVSVIIPTYYRNERLRGTIISVIEQGYKPVEVIVVDGSGDGHARSVAEEFDDVEYIAQPADKGPHAARSLGAERASGDYVQFLDDDDRLLDTKLLKQVSFLHDHPGVGVVYCGWRTESGHVLLPNKSFKRDVLEQALRLRGSTCLTSTMLLRANILEEILPFSNQHGADDVGMKIELARRTQFGYIDEPLIVRGEPETNLGHSWDAIEGRYEILRRYRHLYDQYPAEVRQAAQANLLRHKGWTLLSQSSWSPEAIVAFAKAALLSPELRTKLVGEFFSSLAGRPGLRVSNRVWHSVTKRI